MTSSGSLNREGWLTALADRVRPLFQTYNPKPFRLTCGWPSKHALGRKAKRVGECFDSVCSKGKVYEIFISPVLDDPLEVAGTVCHEVAHVVAGIDAGHGPKYKKICQYVGLTKGKATQAMPGPALDEKLKRFLDGLGPYPHKAIVPKLKLAEEPKDLTLKCVQCGCSVRISKKWLGEAGPPACGCGGGFVPKALLNTLEEAGDD